MTPCVLGEDDGQVLERARRVMQRTGTDGDPSEFVRERSDRWIIGTVDQARERLAAYEEAGVERILLQHLDHETIEAVALMAQLA